MNADDVDALLARADASLEAARRLLDASVVARRLAVSARTVRRWCSEGRVEHRITAGGHYRIPVAELARLTKLVGQSGHSGHAR